MFILQLAWWLEGIFMLINAYARNNKDLSQRCKAFTSFWAFCCPRGI